MGRMAVALAGLFLGLAAPWLAAAPVLAADPPGVQRAGQFTRIDPPLPAPDTVFLDASGNKRTLADFRGRAVLVNFWATWCAPCVEEMPSLDRLQAKRGGSDFTVLAISEDRGGVKVARPFLEKLGVTRLDLHFDDRMTFARAMGVSGLPTSILIDREGRIVARLLGTREWDSAESIALLGEHLGQ
ncbi:MAG: TlpA family protein disulfide reductase [Alphaproteobacteria bacterium]